MHIAVIGAGAMGCLFGGRLCQAGEQVVLVDVWREQVQKINRSGLTIEHGDHREVVPVSACLPGNLNRVPDLVLLFTKAFHTRDALEGIRSFLSDKACVLTLQNGIGHVELIEAFVPKERIVHGITTYPCDLLGPGLVRAKGEGVVKIGAVAAGRMGHARTIARIFERSGFQCDVSRDVQTSIWEKLAFNAAMNALAAVLRMPVGQIGDSAEGRQIASEVVAEVAEVAARKGIKMALHRVEDTLAMAFREHRDHAPSMLQDILNARPTEIDFINGAVVREAKQVGLAVPVNRTLYRLVKTLEYLNL